VQIARTLELAKTPGSPRAISDRRRPVTDVALTALHLVGREDELAAIVRLLDAREQLPSVAVLPGEAGIGKTTLWLAGIDAAAARDYQIISCRPSEAETGFAFAGLADLLGAFAGDVLPELPPIQRWALEAALLLGESEIQADDRAVAAAFLAALRLIARNRPLCLAVDDIQWLDEASVAALRYALARLEREQVATLLAVRGGLPPWLRRAVPEGRLRTIEIGGLSVGALRELLLARLDATFPRPILIRLWETSGGNPFFALELAGALQRRGGTIAPGEELPVPADLDKLLHTRLAGLSATALEAARAVAALAEPTVLLVEAAVGRRADAGLADALAARILELEGERLRFTHPLFGSAVAARQTPSRRRSLHAKLATLVPTAEERARHLALATAEPNHEIATILEDAARSAHARGAPAAAAELAEQALRLTPPVDVDDGRRRLLLAADRHHAAGDARRAVALLSRAQATAAPGVERATLLASLAGVQSNYPDAVALYREALSEAEGDGALQATIHLSLAELMRFTDGIERGVEHAELAVRAAERVGDAALRCRALAAYGLLYFNAGRGIPAQMEAALSLGDAAAALEHLRRTHQLRKAMSMGEPGVRLDLGDLLEALIAVGEIDEADEVLTTWEARAAILDRTWALAILARCRALLLAAQGDLDGAFVSFDRALSEHARCGTDPFHHARTLLALGRTQRRGKQRGLARTTLEEARARFERLGAPLWAEQARAELARIGGRAPSRGELTESERRIARLVAEGKKNREIAAALFLTEHSVETALTQVYQKLGVRSRAELAHRLAINN